MRKIQYTHHIFDDLILAILSLDFEKVVAEVEEVETTLLSQKDNDGTASPVQPISKTLPARQNTDNTERPLRWSTSRFKK